MNLLMEFGKMKNKRFKQVIYTLIQHCFNIFLLPKYKILYCFMDILLLIKKVINAVYYKALLNTYEFQYTESGCNN